MVFEWNRTGSLKAPVGLGVVVEREVLCYSCPGSGGALFTKEGEPGLRRTSLA